jgi:hypothetical protein
MFNKIIIITILLFPVSIGFILENELSGITYGCDENVLVCNGDETDDQITGTNNNIIYGG